jgi:lipoprotein-anchoring transpeptidase ErfK/SrfK
MLQRSAPPIFSRIIMVLMAIASLGAAFWFGMQALEPVPVPPPPPAKSRVTFNPNVDVSKNTVFQRLEPLGPATIEPGELGRVNPFVPIMAPSTSTAPELVMATSTTSTTSTSDIPTSTQPFPLDDEPPPETLRLPMTETSTTTP